MTLPFGSSSVPLAAKSVVDTGSSEISSNSKSDNSREYLVQSSSANTLHSLQYDFRKSNSPGISWSLAQT